MPATAVSAGAETRRRTLPSRRPSEDLLLELPPPLATHVEATKEAGRNLAPWIDVRKEPPSSPLLGLVAKYTRDYASGPGGNGEKRSPKTIRQARRSIFRIIGAAGFWDVTEIDARRVGFTIGGMAIGGGFDSCWLRRLHNNFRSFMSWLKRAEYLGKDPFDGWSVDACIQFDEELRSRFAPLSWYMLELYEAEDQPTYHEPDVILDELLAKDAAELQELARLKIRVFVSSPGADRNLRLRWTDPQTGKRQIRTAGTKDDTEARRVADALEDELNAAPRDDCPSILDTLMGKDQEGKRQWVAGMIGNVREARDKALGIGKDDWKIQGSRQLLMELCVYWENALARLTRHRQAWIRDRLRAFPKAVMVAIAGSHGRYTRKPLPGRTGSDMVRRYLREARREDTARIAAEQPKGSTYGRRHWALQKELDGVARAEIFREWNLRIGAKGRTEICPTCPRSYTRLQAVALDVRVARKETPASDRHFEPKFHKPEQRPCFERDQVFLQKKSQQKKSQRKKSQRKMPQDEWGNTQIAEWWNALATEERERICPASPGPVTHKAVARATWLAEIELNPATGIERLRQRRHWDRDHRWRQWRREENLKDRDILERHNQTADPADRLPTRSGLERIRALQRINGAIRLADWEAELERLVAEKDGGGGAKAEQIPETPPATGTQADRAPRKRGPKGPRSDRKKDKQISEAWKTGRWKTKAHLAAEMALPLKEVVYALERVRNEKRRKYQK